MLEPAYKRYHTQRVSITSAAVKGLKPSLDVYAMWWCNVARPSVVPGFGFLTFDSEESAEAVVKEHFVQLNGKQVRQTRER